MTSDTPPPTSATAGMGQDARDALPLPRQLPARKGSSMHELRFMISTFCHSGGCVGVAAGPDDSVVVINTTTAGDDRLSFTAAEWDTFVAGVKNGEFDRRTLQAARA